MPSSSSDQAARSGALLAPAEGLGTLTVTGSERLSWLQGVVTSDVAALAPGEGRWGLVLTRQGKILADVRVVAAADRVYLGVPKDAVARIAEYLASFLIMEDAELVDTSDTHAWITLHGPLAQDVARRVAGEVNGDAAAVDLTGLGGAVLVVARAAEGPAREAALAAGAVAGSDEQVRTLRVERLVPVYGVDMDEKRSPHEASLERRAVSWTKGCYLGQEAVCMQDMRGKVKRRLAVLSVDAEEPPAPGTAVLDAAGAAVGETRSAARSSVFGRPVALALLSAAVAMPGARLTVSGAPAEVVDPR
jgi:folate-binding protein YgfZ